jgi:hypothetical protein
LVSGCHNNQYPFQNPQRFFATYVFSLRLQRETVRSRKGAKKGRRRKEFALTESLSFEIAFKYLEISKGPFTNLPRS